MEGRVVNLKKVYRIYCEEGLQVRKRKRKKLSGNRRLPLVMPTRPNERWSMDFVSDTFESGRKFRTLNIIDDFTRESIAIEVATSIPGRRVIGVS
jgi:putative transposase